ncbi:probable amino acid permease 7 isoform X2 [Miscanthus floridulus]|uniref:probable amino acid permease 7 isoform X2 n=1 Tax=Miscanthus floridulus TaxID=154761 RepID=UPI00345885A5
MALGEGGDHGAATLPLIADQAKHGGGGGIVRSGSMWTAAAHVITAVIGSGVLSLAWSIAQLGWVAGPAAMLVFAAVTALQSTLFADCYRSPDPEHGPHRNRTYAKAVDRNLGSSSSWMCMLLQHTALFGYGIAYTITASISCRAILKANCYHEHGHDAHCDYGGSYYMLVFGAAQLLLSFIPDFHDMAWLSVVAAVMSFSYAFIGFGLGLATTIANGTIKGSITGVQMRTPMQKVWRVSQAIGDIAFAYPYSLILLEIQDTLKSPPAENKTMKRASMISILVTTFFYLCCGCFGYAAFGSDAPGNLLTGFGFYEPYWLIDFANACIILHLLGGYQVYSQPIFQFADRFFAERFPDSGFVNDFHTVRFACLPACRVNLLRVCFRTLYVASTTAVAVAFPYFNEVLALLGALNFWPLAIYFPVEMYFIQRNVPRWSARWVVLQTFSVVCLLVSAFALVGSIEGLITQKLG